MSFSEKLQVLRKEHKMSQEQLADRLNVSRQAVSKWESGTSYPEMEKLIEICKVFNCSLDDLTNDEVKELGKNTSQKNTINNIVDEILYITRKTITMLTHISTKDFFSMMFGLFVTLLIIFIIKIPVNLLYKIVNDLLLSINQGGFLSKIWYTIINGAYLILSILLFIYVYKIKYLDNYEEIKKEIVIETKQPNNEKIVEKVIVTTTPSNQKRYALFTILGNLFSIFINIIIVLFSIPFVFSLIGLSALLIISIGLIFKGVLFIGIIIGILSLIVINIELLYLIIQILFKKKLNNKVLGITFIASIVMLGVAAGITFFDVLSFKIYNTNPNIKLKEEVHTFDYNENIKIETEKWSMYSGSVRYEVDDTLTNKVEITVTYPSDYYTYELVQDNNDFIRIYYYTNQNIQYKIFNQIIKDIKNKTIYTYYAGEISLKIRTSQANIDNILGTTEKYFEDLTSKYYEEQIDQLYDEIDRLEEESYNKDNKIIEYEEQIEEYKIKIQEYIDKINDIKDSINY